MLSGVSILILCFTASYVAAFALEVTRLLFRSGIRGAVMLGFAGAGFLAHTTFLCCRVTDAARCPLSSEQGWYLVAAWVLAGTYLYLTCYHRQTPFGLFVLPLILGLIGAATFLANSEPFAREPASKVWSVIHGTSMLLATMAVLTGFAAGMMYLRQTYRLKHKRPAHRSLRLPSLERLQHINSRAIVISALMLGLGILSGTVLNTINFTGRVPWHDPVVLSTVLMFGLIAISIGIGTLYKPARQGHKVAYLTVVSFMFLIIVLGIGMLIETQHGTPEGEHRAIQRPELSIEDSAFRVHGSEFSDRIVLARSPLGV